MENYLFLQSLCQKQYNTGSKWGSWKVEEVTSCVLIVMEAILGSAALKQKIVVETARDGRMKKVMRVNGVRLSKTGLLSFLWIAGHICICARSTKRNPGRDSHHAVAGGSTKNVAGDRIIGLESMKIINNMYNT